MYNQGYSRLLFKEDFFYSQSEHVLLIMAANSNEEHGQILHGIHGFFNGLYCWGLLPPNPNFMPE
jgi:hypothetical protein